MPLAPRDTNQPGCARVGEGTVISRESGGSLQAQAASAKKPLFASRGKCVSAHLHVYTLAINSHDALRYPGKYLPGDRSGFGCKFASQDFLVTLPANKDDLVTELNAS